MEELQSTEILDREILEDARKKAYKILKTADDSIKAKSAEWEKRTADTLKELEYKYAQSKKNAVKEIMAVLPLDKRRAKAKKIEELLNKAVHSWYTGLDRESVLELIRNELAKRIAHCEELNVKSQSINVSEKIRILLHKIEQAEAQAILKVVLPGRQCEIETIQSKAVYPELVLETGGLRVYASVGRTVDFILGEKRAELVESLLGNSNLLEGEMSFGEETL